MKRLMQQWLCVGILMLGAIQVQAKLSQPDYVLYGTATWFGGTLPSESEISIYLNNQLLTVATYRMGTLDDLNGLYALRVPMDSNDPRTFGKARPGDPASIFINGSLVADVLVGDYGVAKRLDIDPINLAGDVSVISVQPGEVAEGNSGQTQMAIEVQLSNTAEADVAVNWNTIDGTAISSDTCAFDVDYIESSGRLTIPIGSDSGVIDVTVCGDTLIESTETFELVISNAENGVIQFDRANGSILDDDGLPELRGFDAVIFEPESGDLVYEFEFKLSRSYEQDVSVSYSTVSDSASENLDFIPVSGTLLIPSGQTSATIPVTYLSDAENESIEVMRIALSTPVNATLVTGSLTAFILDSNQDEQTEEDRVIDSGDVPGLINPSDVVFSEDGKYVYVSSLTDGGSVLRFLFKNGKLTFEEMINDDSVGFESGLFGLIRDLKISNDGQHLYAAASGDNSIMAFSRNPTNGILSLEQTLEDQVSGNIGIDGVYAIDLSPDGSYLYAAGSESNVISVYAINPGDGSLTYVEKEILGFDDPSDAGSVVTFMERPIDITVSPDGKNVYVAADFSSSVVVFARDENDGKLSFQNSYKSGVNGFDGLGGAAAVTVSADNQHVYVLGRATDTLTILARDAQGDLAMVRVLQQQNSDFIGLNAPTAISESPDGSRYYTLGFEDSSMVTFKRDNNAGAINYGGLTFADIEQDESNGVNSLAGPIALDVSNDGQWVIVAAAIDNAITVFKTHLNDLIYANDFE